MSECGIRCKWIYRTHVSENRTASFSSGDTASFLQAIPTSLIMGSLSFTSITPLTEWERNSSEGRNATPNPPCTIYRPVGGD